MLNSICIIGAGTAGIFYKKQVSIAGCIQYFIGMVAALIIGNHKVLYFWFCIAFFYQLVLSVNKYPGGILPGVILRSKFLFHTVLFIYHHAFILVRDGA